MLQIQVNDEGTLTLISDDANAENIIVAEALPFEAAELWNAAEFKDGLLSITTPGDMDAAFVLESLENDFPREVDEALEQLKRVGVADA